MTGPFVSARSLRLLAPHLDPNRRCVEHAEVRLSAAEFKVEDIGPESGAPLVHPTKLA